MIDPHPQTPSPCAQGEGALRPLILGSLLPTHGEKGGG